MQNLQLGASLQGRLRNTDLPVSKCLYPLFEAVVNSIYAIDDRVDSDNEKSKCSTPKQVVAAVLVQRLIRTSCTFLQYAHCNKLSDGFRGTSHLRVKEWTEYIFLDVTGDIAVKLHVPLLLVFVLLAFTLAHQGRCGCEQSELLICSRFLEHIFGLDFYAKLSIFLQITKCQRTI